MNGTKLWLSNLQKNYLSFEGSIQRKEYITRMIILFLLGLFCVFIGYCYHNYLTTLSIYSPNFTVCT